MTKTTSNAKKQTALKNKVKKLQTELAKVNELSNALKVTVQKTDAHLNSEGLTFVELWYNFVNDTKDVSICTWRVLSRL
jgi:hypothetical protein